MKPPRRVDPEAARTEEETFHERFAAAVDACAGIYDPLRRRTWDASPRNRVTKTLDERSTEVKAAVKRLAKRDLLKTYEGMPKNAAVVHEIVHKELLRKPEARVAVAAVSFSPVEDLLREGASSRPAGADELRRVRERIAEREDVFYYVGAFSTTGWTEAARTGLAGPHWLLALSDVRDGAWRTHYAPDPRWGTAARLFDLSSEPEKIEAIRRWVREHTVELVMDELTEDAVFDALGYALPLVRKAFAEIARGDPFVKYDGSSKPHRLVRTYG
jgi:hypothetical protein